MSKKLASPSVGVAMVVALSTFAVRPGVVFAQDQAATGALEEIIVTARRRTENLQQVPVSIEAVLGDEMELRNMERIDDVIAQTPNVFTVMNGPSVSSSFSMRGIPDVGFFVDGIWQTNAQLLKERSTLELDRVEMLRGPQGTLYGRDTTGGAIRLYTRRPAEEFGMRVTATTGSYDRLDLTANVDIPLTDSFFTKWTVSRNQRDGYQQSLEVDEAYGEVDDEMLRGDLYWTPTDRLNFRLILEDSTQRTTHTNGTILFVDPGPPGPSPGLGFIVPPRQYYEIIGLQQGFQYNNVSHASGWPGGEVGEHETKIDWDGGHGALVDSEAWTLNVEWDITDRLSFTSLTGWREQGASSVHDFDSSAFQFFAQNNLSKEDTITQEFQFTGSGERISWVAGAFAWEENSQSRLPRWGMTDFVNKDGNPGPVPPGKFDFLDVLNSPFCQAWTPASGLAPCITMPNTDSFNGDKQDGWAVFGEVTIDLTDTLSLTLGARQHDQTNESFTYIFGPDAPRRADFEELTWLAPDSITFQSVGTAGHSEVSFDADTYRFALTNQFNDDLMAYIGYSEGFNSGGESTPTILDGMGNQVTLVFPFEPEKIENIEIGVRSDWLDGRLRFNATYFQTDWLDLQLGAELINPFTGELVPNTVISNVAEAEANGAEFTLTGQFEQFRFDVGLGLLDTAYTRINEGVPGLDQGDRFGLAPDSQYNIGLQWDGTVRNGGGVTLRMDYTWTDDYIRSYAPDRQLQDTHPGIEYDQLAFGLLSARVIYRPSGGQWEVAAFGTNLTDEFYMQGGFNPAILAQDYSSIARPREAGITLKLFFE